jgi:hypothetical protein
MLQIFGIYLVQQNHSTSAIELCNASSSLKQLLGGLDLLDMMHASGSILIVLNPVIGTEHELKT